MSGFAQLERVLREEGGLLADALTTAAAARDPLVDGASGERALVLAAVREGYLLHYDRGHVVRPDDADLALLGGDRLYALGLARLAESDDLEAVAQLADLISRCAQAHADGDPALAAEAWRAAASNLAR
jgi:hypothetical protein